MSVCIGVDTGGTYTDAVLFDRDRGVLRSAKALTTRHNLALGIGEAIATVLRGYRGPVAFVSVSTTLATNALAEQSGAPICIVLLGYPEHAIDQHIAEQAFGDDPVVRLAGGHTVEGDQQQPLDLAGLQRVARDYAARVSAFAVSGYFSVRNPLHEITARRTLLELTGLPVSCGHELSLRLHAGRRALTTAWNARLIPLLTGLVAAVRRVMAERDLRCPLMMVKGDGSLVNAETAQQHAVQTILSGPAASVVGAQFLHRFHDACVVDIGGTTTDIAFIRDGRPVVSPDGARVGGLRTMVPAVQMHTFALGGDSAVRLSDDGRIRFGPDRIIPASLALHADPAARRELEEDAVAAGNGERANGVFLMASPSHAAGGAVAATLSPSQLSIVEAVQGGLVSRTRLLSESRSQYRAVRDIRRLMRRGAVLAAGFTPSDAAHILERQQSWSREAAVLAAVGIYHQSTARGLSVFGDGGLPEAECQARAVAAQVYAAFVAASARSIVAAAICDTTGTVLDTHSPLSRALVDNAVQHASGRSAANPLLAAALRLMCPIVAVGAPAACYYGDVATVLQTTSVVPEHSEVANAVGAVVGEVRAEVEVRVTPLNGGETFRVHMPEGTIDLESLERAEAVAMQRADAAVRDRARAAGASEYEVSLQQRKTSTTVNDGEMLIELVVLASAIGRPQLWSASCADCVADGLDMLRPGSATSTDN